MSAAGSETWGSAVVRPIRQEDAPAITRFSERVPEGERRFLKEELVAMFQDMGFVPAALLPDFVRDSAGDFHDLMLLAHRVDDQWGLHSTLGLDEVVA